MTKFKILTGFTKFTDSGLLVKAKIIRSGMEKNVNYPDPSPPLTDVAVAITDYENSLSNSGSGGKLDTAVKEQKRTVLENLLTNLGLYVQANGKNDESILLSSGYDLQKQRTPVGMLAKPENIKVMPGRSTGSLKVSINSIPGADSYLFNYTEMPLLANSNWQLMPSSKATVLINGLESGKQYAFKVAGVGSNPDLVFSDIVTSFVL